MAHSASDCETHRWLREDNVFDENLWADFVPSTVQRLYRASDALVDHWEVAHCTLQGQSHKALGGVVQTAHT